MLGSRLDERVREVYAGPFAARWLGYFQSKGLRADVIDLAGRSDHAPFAQRGIPTGGLFAGIPRCYHLACDRVSSVDFVLLRELAAAAAFGVAEFAPPARAQRSEIATSSRRSSASCMPASMPELICASRSSFVLC